MPAAISTPGTTDSIDRLHLGMASVRGAEPSIPGTCCPPYMCFDSAGDTATS